MGATDLPGRVREQSRRGATDLPGPEKLDGVRQLTP